MKKGWKNLLGRVFGVAITLLAAGSQASGAEEYELYLRSIDSVPTKSIGKMDLDALAAEDAVNDELPGHPKRFAVAHRVEINPGNAGEWTRLPDGDWLWRLRIRAAEAAHLNFGFGRFALPPGAELNIVATNGSSKIGPFTVENMLEHGQLWTPVVMGEEALLHLRVPAAARDAVVLELTQVNQGYRGFGVRSKACKSGSCNTDVACLSAGDPWNGPRRAVGAWTAAGVATCTGSLVNNTDNDHRMLFATATHCGIDSDAAAATVLVYWNYESPTCRVPGSAESGQPVAPPSATTQGLRFLAQTAVAGAGSDFTLLELATPPADNSFDLFWAGWDRRVPPAVCAAPGDPASTRGLCASIHHPGVDEKRITFVESNLVLASYNDGTAYHWQADWDPTPPRLPNISPMPATLPPSVTEPGSSGSPLYNAQQRLIGVLSGGPSYCGATGADLRDYYGGLFDAWDGLGTATTRVKDYLDPAGSNPWSIDGVSACTPPAIPTGLGATAGGSNLIELRWNAVSGASAYRIYRSVGSCPGSGFAQIATVTGTTYSDRTVSGGTGYIYKVAAYDGATQCLSAPSSCAGATATGACTLPPTFAGLASASSAATTSCGIDLEWGTATSNCGGSAGIRYNVYKSSSPDFTPGNTNLLANCTSATSYTDNSAAPEVAQYYVVRAEDIGIISTSGRCGGVEEGNLVRHSAAPSGPATLLLNDDVEGGNMGWGATGSGAGANFTIVTSNADSPTHSWFVGDPPTLSDRRLTRSSSLRVAANAILEFSHTYDTEPGFDGAVLEYSLDGGATWADILAANGAVAANAQRFITGGYDQQISTWYSSTLAGRDAWSGSSGGFVTTQVALADFAARNLLLRFRFASDSSVEAAGWWIDDIRISQATRCTATAVVRCETGTLTLPAPGYANGTYDLSSELSITSEPDAQVEIGSGVEMTLAAPNISFKPGFRAADGSKLMSTAGSVSCP